jgi:uncharacterized protein YjbI with pentapeptide repeats
LDSERNSDILQFFREAQLIRGTDPVISLNSSNLNGAQLSGVDLRRADLSEVDLSIAILINANLRDAFLENAKLGDAFGITNEELVQQAASLEGATMPNGQKYEDWLKSKDREENWKKE